MAEMDEQIFEDSRAAEEDSIEVTGLTKTFDSGSVIACEDIDLSISSDEFVVLLGPSGCGKTTTLRCIAGLETPDEGAIKIIGRDVTYNKPKDRDLAFVFQDVALFTHMTVRENIRFGLDMSTDLSETEKEERVRETAELLGIGDLLDRKPSELSGGQQQRVSIGRAMVMEPTAFLLDEPFAALDANLRDQMQIEVKKLQKNLGRAVIFVTHDQAEAMTVGTKIVVMNDGQIQQVGTPYEIYNDPVNEFVATFIGSPKINTFDCDVVQQNGTYRLQGDLFSFSLSGDNNRIGKHADETVRIGMRPENLQFNSSRPLFDATVNLVEPQGSQDNVFLKAEEYEIRATTPQEKLVEGERVEISFDQEQMWVFSSSGERLL